MHTPAGRHTGTHRLFRPRHYLCPSKSASHTLGLCLPIFKFLFNYSISFILFFLTSFLNSFFLKRRDPRGLPLESLHNLDTCETVVILDPEEATERERESLWNDMADCLANEGGLVQERQRERDRGKFLMQKSGGGRR